VKTLAFIEVIVQKIRVRKKEAFDIISVLFVVI